MSVTITPPNAAAIELAAGDDKTVSGVAYQVFGTTSSRGTYVLRVVAQAVTGITAGDYSVAVKSVGTATTVKAVGAAYASSRENELVWDAGVLSNLHTVWAVSVADHCFTIAAMTGYAGVGSGSEPALQLRAYSSRGPRIDGAPLLDLAAPDNPLAALGPAYSYRGLFIPFGGAWHFGGTSGATPHVAGAAALLFEQGMTNVEVDTLFRNNANTDDIAVPIPNEDWGYGRLDLEQVVSRVGINSRPQITLSVLSKNDASTTIMATVSDEEDTNDALLVRWDDGYDGVWETEYGAARTYAFPTTQEPHRIKARVRDSEGLFSAATLLVVGDGTGMTDAGAQSDAGVATDGGNTDGGVAKPNPEGGCGCRVSARGSDQRGMWLALLIMVSLIRRRHNRGC